jgi:TRAP-type C4-dicarboxylate transport system permease small subunit
MKASFDPQFDCQFSSLPGDPAALAYSAQVGVALGARACVVNRTHRVVRERAKVMQARRSRARSLMAPLAICSVLLILTCFAIWTGMYQYQATEAVQTDITGLATTDASNHFLVVLLWFVPVSFALLAAVLYRRRRNGVDREAIR